MADAVATVVGVVGAIGCTILAIIPATTVFAPACFAGVGALVGLIAAVRENDSAGVVDSIEQMGDAYKMYRGAVRITASSRRRSSTRRTR